MTSTTTFQPAAGTAAQKPGRSSGAGPLRAVLALPAFGFSGDLAWIAFTNIFYPLRPQLGLPGYTRDSWGGPTYAGVWAVHGAAGLAMAAIAFLIARPYVRGLARRRRSR
jgi:hypothetical protein